MELANLPDFTYPAKLGQRPATQGVTVSPAENGGVSTRRDLNLNVSAVQSLNTAKQ